MSAPKAVGSTKHKYQIIYKSDPFQLQRHQQWERHQKRLNEIQSRKVKAKINDKTLISERLKHNQQTVKRQLQNSKLKRYKRM